jgi:benzoate-CoA ligase family protein
MIALDLPRRFNAADYFIERHVVKDGGGRTAVLAEDREYSYAEVLERVNRAANLLAGLGVRMEERVLLLLADSPEMLFAFFGAMKLGAVPVPGNILMKAPDFRTILNDSRARVLIVEADLLPEIEAVRREAPFLEHLLVCRGPDRGYPAFEELSAAASPEAASAPTTPDDSAFWLYSGRNPARLMAAVHHHSHPVYCARAYADGILGMTERDRVLASFLFFAYGLGNGLFFPLHAGGSTVLVRHPPKPERVYADLVRFRPTLFFTVPTLLQGLVDHARERRAAGRALPPLEGLRACISSAEILSPEVYRRFTQTFGVEVLEGTGSTEIGHIFLSNRFGEVRPGTTGRPVPGYRVRLVDDDGREVAPGQVGNLLVSGGSIASAYWNQRAETRANMQGEWFVTGDRYTVDADGCYTFRGRSDDMLRVGGKWLAPGEVEHTLSRHPAVAESAVVGQRDPDALVTPVAFIVLKPGHAPSPALAEEIQRFVKQRLAAYKYPRRIAFVEGLPKTAGGRVQRFLLQEQANREAADAHGQ